MGFPTPERADVPRSEVDYLGRCDVWRTNGHLVLIIDGAYIPAETSSGDDARAAVLKVSRSVMDRAEGGEQGALT